MKPRIKCPSAKQNKYDNSLKINKSYRDKNTKIHSQTYSKEKK